MQGRNRRTAKLPRSYFDLARIVVQNPGIRFRELLRASGLASGTLQHRLGLLEKSEIIRVHRSWGFARYYSSRMKSSDVRILFYLKRRPFQQIILLLLGDSSGTFTLRKFVQILGKSPSTVSSQLRQLVAQRIVRLIERQGYVVNNKRIIKRALSRYRNTIFVFAGTQRGQRSYF